MVNTINQIVFLIKQIVDAEQEYMIGNGFSSNIHEEDTFNNRLIFCRQKLIDIITYIKTEYENINVTICKTECKFYQIFLCKKLNYIKHLILFEDNLINKINEEIQLFYEKVNIIFYRSFKEDNFNTEDTLISSTNNFKNKRLNYPNKVVRVLKGWLERNILDPYPSEDQKEEFCEKTGLEMNQINNWFINARRRILPQLKRNYEKYI